MIAAGDQVELIEAVQGFTMEFGSHTPQTSNSYFDLLHPFTLRSFADYDSTSLMLTKRFSAADL